MRVYGICGRKQAGKDTFARLGCDLLDRAGRSSDTEIARLAFAEPLKQFCIDYLGLSRNGCYGSDEEKDETCGTWEMFNESIRNLFDTDLFDPISNREVLQVVGTEVFRNCFRGTFWIDLMSIRMRQAEKSGAELVFVTDVRFKNEIRAIQELGGKLIRVIRDTGKEDQIPHASELEMLEIPNSEFDFVVDNNGSIEEYCDKIESILIEEDVL